MGQNELGEHFYRNGDLNSALKCYTNTRDYLTNPAHIVEMCVRILEVSMELKQYHSIQGYIMKAKQVPQIAEANDIKINSIAAIFELESNKFKSVANRLINFPIQQVEHLWGVKFFFT
jgi:COP9 signalosome complex subunit 1